jgi:predicted transcriptional regulator
MTKDQIDLILDRVRTWPPARQEDAVRLLLELEARHQDVYRLSDEERADILEGLSEIERGEMASDDEVAAFFSSIKR